MANSAPPGSTIEALKPTFYHFYFNLTPHSWDLIHGMFTLQNVFFIVSFLQGKLIYSIRYACTWDVIYDGLWHPEVIITFQNIRRG